MMEGKRMNGLASTFEFGRYINFLGHSDGVGVWFDFAYGTTALCGIRQDKGAVFSP